MDEQKDHCDLPQPIPECPEEENRIAHDGESNTGSAKTLNVANDTDGHNHTYGENNSGSRKALTATSDNDTSDHSAGVEPAVNSMDKREEESRSARNEEGDARKAKDVSSKELDTPEKGRRGVGNMDDTDQDRQVFNEMNHAAKLETEQTETNSTENEPHTPNQTIGTEEKRYIESQRLRADKEGLNGTNQGCFHGEERRASRNQVDLNDKHNTGMSDCDQEEQCASMVRADCREQEKHSSQNDHKDSEASTSHCSDNCDTAIKEDNEGKHSESNSNNNACGESGTKQGNDDEEALVEDQADSMTGENKGSFLERSTVEADLSQKQGRDTEMITDSTSYLEQIGDSLKSPGSQTVCHKTRSCTDNPGDERVPHTNDSTTTTSQSNTGETNPSDNQDRESSTNQTCDNSPSTNSGSSISNQNQTEEPRSLQSGDNPLTLCQSCETATPPEVSSNHPISTEGVSREDQRKVSDTIPPERDYRSTIITSPPENVSTQGSHPAADSNTVSSEQLSRNDHLNTTDTFSPEEVSSRGPHYSKDGREGVTNKEQQGDTLDGNNLPPHHHPQQQEWDGVQRRESDESSWAKKTEECYDCSDSTGDEEEEEVDPRVAENLEIMNQSCADVNRLENELDEARHKYRLTFQTSSQRMEELGSKIKKSIQRARLYFELTEKAKEAQNEAVRAARQYQTASGHYRAAKEMITLAEQSFYNKDAHTTHNLTSALQETLNHATERVMESEREKTRSEAEHNKRAAIFAQLETQLQQQEKKYKRSITKARPYFETKAELELKLQQLKQNIHDLQQAISTRKARYAEALRNLETVSTEIHESRRSRQKMLLQYPREPGVGAESDSLCSNISDNIERNVFSSTASYEYDDEDEDDLSDDSSEVSSQGSRGHSRQNSRDRPLVTKSSSLRREERRHKRSVSSGSAPGSVFSSPPGSLPQSPASLNSPDVASSPGFPVVPVFAANSGSSSGGGGGNDGGGGTDGVAATNATTTSYSATASSLSNASSSGTISSSSASVFGVTSSASASVSGTVSSCGPIASGTKSSSSASVSGIASPPAAAVSGLAHSLMDIAKGDCSDSEVDEAKGKTSTVEQGSGVPEPSARETETVSPVEIQERVDGDGSAQEDCPQQGEKAALSTVKTENSHLCSLPPLPPQSSKQQSAPVRGSSTCSVPQSSSVTSSSGQHPPVTPPSAADHAHNTPRQFFTKAKQFLKKATSAPHAHARLDNRSSGDKDVNANPQARIPFHIGSAPNPVQPYLGPGLSQTGVVPSQNGAVPAQKPTSVQSAKGNVEVKKQPLRRTDGGRGKPLQGIFFLNPTDLASSSASSNPSSSFQF